MDDQAIYGALMIAYLIPYVVWTIARDQKVEILKQFYPGRADEEAIERRGNAVGIVWVAGMLVLLIGWKLESHPLPIFGIVVFGWACFAAFRKILRTKNLFRTRKARSIASVATIWSASVLGWYLVFGDRYGFEPRDAVLIALVPCVIGFIAYGAYRWVNRGQA